MARQNAWLVVRQTEVPAGSGRVFPAEPTGGEARVARHPARLWRCRFTYRRICGGGLGSGPGGATSCLAAINVESTIAASAHRRGVNRTGILHAFDNPDRRPCRARSDEVSEGRTMPRNPKEIVDQSEAPALPSSPLGERESCCSDRRGFTLDVQRQGVANPRTPTMFGVRRIDGPTTHHRDQRAIVRPIRALHGGR